ncbi:MAG: hypothetical protein JSW00_00990 [Thermoplasmata archaeon]|nr:MAG: hypothetical protein JSW00_00990 [Thermoplasmata archaeon]
MDPDSDELLPPGQKTFAVIVLLILLSATLAASLVLYEPRRPRRRSEEEEMGITFENIAVTDVPENNNEPSIAVDPNDPLHLVAAGNDYGTPNGDAWVGYYVSWDGGKNWSRDLIPGYFLGPISPLSGYDGAGDPVVCFGPEGNVYISGICFKRATNPANPVNLGLAAGRDNGIFVAKSTDGGETFNQISILVLAFQTPIAFHDKEWMAVDMDNGNVYVTWAVFTMLSRVNILLSRSTDGGNSFSIPQVISDFFTIQKSMQGTTIQVTPDGTVHVFWTNFGADAPGDERIMYIYSSDEGQSFTEPRSICETMEIPRNELPNCEFRTPTLLMSAVDLSDTNTSGSLYVTWNDYREGDADIMLIYSRDNGETWSDAIRVNNDTEGNGKDQFFSAVAVSDQGYVHLIFYDRRDDDDNTVMHIYYALSKSGGENFAYQTNITTESFDGNNAQGSSPFIGDYIGLTASNTTAYGIWCDTREATEGSPDCELYFAYVEFACVECAHEEEA